MSKIFKRAILLKNGFFFKTIEEADLFIVVMNEKLWKLIRYEIISNEDFCSTKDLTIISSNEKIDEWLKINQNKFKNIIIKCKEKLFYEIITNRDKFPGLVTEFSPEVRKITIEDLDLLVSTYTVLKRAGIKTLEDILNHKDILDIGFCLQRNIDELICKLGKLGK